MIFPIASKENNQTNNKNYKLPLLIKQQLGIQKAQINEQDQQFLYIILIQILKYPSLKLSQLHYKSNHLGEKDLLSNSQQHKQHNHLNASKQNIFQITEQSFVMSDKQTNQHKPQQRQFCQCCGLAKQHQSIRICQKFQNFPKVGLSTFLYFQTLKNIFIFLLVLAVVFGLFSMVGNYLLNCELNNLTTISGLSQISQSYVTIFSLKIKQKPYSILPSISTYVTVQAFLTIIVVIVWSILFYIFKHYQIIDERMIDDESVTASDFSVMVENAPISLFDKKNRIQQQIIEYFRSISNLIQKQYIQKYKLTQITSIDQQIDKLRLLKFNMGIPFHFYQHDQDQQLSLLVEKRQDHRKKLIQWLQQFIEIHKFTVKSQRRQKRVQQLRQIEQKIKVKKQEASINHTFLNLIKEDVNTTFFLTFNSALAAKIIYQQNPNNILSKLGSFFSCCILSYRLQLKDFRNNRIAIELCRAPQPQDIKWQNIGISKVQILIRRLLTFLITFCILFGSFYLITFLSEIQLNTKDSFISIVISASLTGLNVIIGQIIFKLTQFQMDITQTGHQASLSIKSIIAQLINSIAIPLMVKKDNIYGEKGLVEDVFYMALINAITGPILKYINLYHFFTRIRYWYKSSPLNRIGINQTQLNKYAQLVQFEIGSQYIYITNIFLFTCFYTPLQPIIPLISLIGLGLMYWIQKYTLLNRNQRPIPGDDTINLVIAQLVTLGPVLFASGFLIFNYFFTANSGTNFNFLIQIISVGFGALFYLLPFNTVYRKIFSEDLFFQNLNYQQKRILLPTEYDRLNPATSQQGMNDFIQYQKQIKEKTRDNQYKETIPIVDIPINNTKQQPQIKNNIPKFQVLQTNIKKIQKTQDYSRRKQIPLLRQKRPSVDKSIQNKNLQIKQNKSFQPQINENITFQQNFQQEEFFSLGGIKSSDNQKLTSIKNKTRPYSEVSKSLNQQTEKNLIKISAPRKEKYNLNKMKNFRKNNDL